MNKLAVKTLGKKEVAELLAEAEFAPELLRELGWGPGSSIFRLRDGQIIVQFREKALAELWGNFDALFLFNQDSQRSAQEPSFSRNPASKYGVYDDCPSK